MLVTASLLSLGLLAAEPSRVRFEACEDSGLNTALAAGLFAASAKAQSAELLHVTCRPDGSLLIRRGGQSRQVTLSDVEPSLKAQSLALLLVEVDAGRVAAPPKKPPPAPPSPLPPPAPVATVAVVPPPDSTTLEVEAPTAPASAPTPVAAPPKDAPVAAAPVEAAPTVALTPRAATLEVAPLATSVEKERSLRIAGGFTLGLGVLFLACALTGSMLLAYAQTPEIRGAAYTMLGLSVASLVGTGVAFGVWLGERNR